MDDEKITIEPYGERIVSDIDKTYLNKIKTTISILCEFIISDKTCVKKFEEELKNIKYYLDKNTLSIQLPQYWDAFKINYENNSIMFVQDNKMNLRMIYESASKQFSIIKIIHPHISVMNTDGFGKKKEYTLYIIVDENFYKIAESTDEPTIDLMLLNGSFLKVPENIEKEYQKIISVLNSTHSNWESICSNWERIYNNDSETINYINDLFDAMVEYIKNANIDIDEKNDKENEL